MTQESDDEDLAIRMMCGDKEALREVLHRYLEPARDLLTSTYATTVQPLDIDEAMNVAIYRMFYAAGKYDKTKGTLRAWFYTIAQRAVIEIFRREKRHRRKHPLRDVEIDPPDTSNESENDEPLSKERKKELRELDNVIENKLKGHQKAIIKADLVADGVADAACLAEMLNTSKESIYVSRHKAHENIRKEMMHLIQERERSRGTK